MSPRLFGGIGDQSGAGRLDLRGGVVNLVLGEIGWPKPDKQRRIIGGNPFTQLEQIAGSNFCACRADNLCRGTRQSVQAGDAKLNRLSVAIGRRGSELATDAKAGGAANVERDRAVIVGAEGGGANFVRLGSGATEERLLTPRCGCV